MCRFLITNIALFLSAARIFALDGYWQKIYCDSSNRPFHSFQTIAIDYWQNLFVGTSKSEVFRSKDFGLTWQLVHKDSDRFPNLSRTVSSIVIMPNGHVVACKWNDGIYLSEDHGESWMCKGLDGYSINKAGVHPDGRIYIASQGPTGLYTSHDEGIHWVKIKEKYPDFHKEYNIYSIAFGANYKIYLIVDGIAACSDNEAPYGFLLNRSLIGQSIFVAKDQTIIIGMHNGTVLLSSDNGRSFVSVSIPDQNSCIDCFAEDRDGNLYFGTRDNGIWRSINRGLTWTKEIIEQTDINELVADSSGVVYAAAEFGVFKRIDKPLAVREQKPVSQPSCTLFPAYPNPFNSSITIEFQSAGDYITVNIIDINGRVVATPCEHQISKGLARVSWHGQDSKGAPVASGVYFIALRSSEAGTKIALQKVIMLK